MLQIQGKVDKGKARATVYENSTHIQSRTCTKDEAKHDEVTEEKYIKKRQKLTIATEELDKRSRDQLATVDKTSVQKIKTVQRKPKVRIEDAKQTADRRGAMKNACKSERNKEDMVEIISKLLRQQTAPDVDINIFSEDPY